MIADRTETPSIGERGTHSVVRERRLAAHIHDHAFGTDRVRAEQRPFEQLVRIAFEQLAVLERAGLGLVAVHDDVRRPFRREKAPLLGGRERAAAAPPGEAGGAHLVEHPVPTASCH